MPLPDSVRFARQTALTEVGRDGQEKFARAHVAIVGLGGLGCPAAAYLTSSGVGRLSLIDGDCVSLSNLPRQNLFSEADIGRAKVSAAAELLRRMREEILLDVADRHLTVSNAADLLGDADLVLDCTDNFGTKYLINDFCVSRNIPFVFAGIDRFAAQVGLFQYRNGPTLRCVFPNPTPDQNARQCSTDGILATATGIIGTMQAHLALLCLIDLPEAAVDSLRVINLLTLESRRLSVRRSSSATRDGVVRGSRYYDSLDPRCVKSRIVTPEKLRELFASSVRPLVIDLSAHDLLGKRETVRQTTTTELDTTLAGIPIDMPLLIHCETGVKSAFAIERLTEEKGYANVWQVNDNVVPLLIDLMKSWA